MSAGDFKKSFLLILFFSFELLAQKKSRHPGRDQIKILNPEWSRVLSVVEG